MLTLRSLDAENAVYNTVLQMSPNDVRLAIGNQETCGLPCESKNKIVVTIVIKEAQRLLPNHQISKLFGFILFPNVQARADESFPSLL